MTQVKSEAQKGQIIWYICKIVIGTNNNNNKKWYILKKKNIYVSY